ncbi:MAG: phosphatidate cytidylyltransferase [Lachnospiraceae bacterium]|nr:phosphatidate cytidylyltransferase [Lachnospiraceae bacterium]
MLRTRVFSAIVLVAVLGAGLYYGGLLWWVLLLFISIIGYNEFCRAVRRIPVEGKSNDGSSSDEDPRYETALPEIAGYLLSVAYYVVILLSRKYEYMIFTIVIAVVVFMICFVARYPEYDNGRILKDFFGFLYIPVMISFLYLIRLRENGFTEVLLVVISSWICDTFAYFTGRAFGRHKLAPVLSPKKSVEGAVGGTLFSALFGALLALLTHGNIGVYALVAASGAVVSQFGDLFASGIKRDQGIKDYGNVIPGHGGILDRFDSMIITAPVIYILCCTMA